MNEKQIERLKKIVADSTKRIEDQLLLKAKDVLGRLLSTKADNKKKD
jgi:hypothetical protein